MIRSFFCGSRFLLFVAFCVFALQACTSPDGPADKDFGNVFVEVSLYKPSHSKIPIVSYHSGDDHQPPDLSNIPTVMNENGYYATLPVYVNSLFSNLELNTNQPMILVDIHMYDHSLHTSDQHWPSYTGIPRNPAKINIDNVWNAITEVLSSHHVDKDCLAISGHSRWAELALLLSTRHEEIKAVIATAPPSMTFFQKYFNTDYLYPQSTWWSGGSPTEFVPYPFVAETTRLAKRYNDGDLSASRELHILAMETYKPAVERSKFDVTAIKANLFISAGSNDVYWPSIEMMDEFIEEYRLNNADPRYTYDSHTSGHNLGGNTQNLFDIFMAEQFLYRECEYTAFGPSSKPSSNKNTMVTSDGIVGLQQQKVVPGKRPSYSINWKDDVSDDFPVFRGKKTFNQLDREAALDPRYEAFFKGEMTFDQIKNEVEEERQNMPVPSTPPPNLNNPAQPVGSPSAGNQGGISILLLMMLMIRLVCQRACPLVKLNR